MKTKEEIEQLADEWLTETPIKEWGGVENGFIIGYTKCQEDNKDKKYTEEDLRKAIEVGVKAEAGDYPKGFSYKLGITLEDYFINSLNK